MNYNESYLTGLRRCIQINDFSELKGKSILVTGASGLIGSAVSDVLFSLNIESKYDLKIFVSGRNKAVIDSRFAFWGSGEYTFIAYDEEKGFAENVSVDYVIHCASCAHPALYANQPVETLLSNIEGTKHALEFARNNDAKRFLLVSSSEVYGQREGFVPYAEDEYFLVDPLDSRSCYPNSKRSCETLCVAYNDEYGVDCVIARPGHVWGPTATMSDSRAHAQFARQAAAGQNIVLKSKGEQLRSYIFSTDCAVALLTVLLQGETCEAYNIGIPNFTCTIKQLAEALAEAGNVKLEFDLPTENEAKGYNKMQCSALDCEKLKALGFVQLYSLKEAAEETVKAIGYYSSL